MPAHVPLAVSEATRHTPSCWPCLWQVAAALYEGLIEPADLVRNWVVTYAGNLIGSVLFAYAFQYTGLLTGTTAAMAAKVAKGKCAAAMGARSSLRRTGRAAFRHRASRAAWARRPVAPRAAPALHLGAPPRPLGSVPPPRQRGSARAPKRRCSSTQAPRL